MPERERHPTRHKRRWIRILAIVAVVLATVVGGLLVTLRLTSPPPLGDESSADPRAIPESWLEAEASPPARIASTSPQTQSLVATDQPPPSEPLALTGRLAFYGGDRPFGEERYEIRTDEDGVTLTSTGEFRFRALVATLRVSFDQSLATDGEFMPRDYRADFDAPFGFDRDVRSVIRGGVARTTASGVETEATVGDDVILLGTFGTYALLPILMANRPEEGPAEFEVLILGGPPGEETTTESGLPRMTVERLSPAEIRVAERTLVVDAFRVTSDLGASLLLAKDSEFLAFLAGEEENRLAVFRSDFFPDGFEILSPAGSDLGASPSRVP
jgi:hypothetical protein